MINDDCLQVMRNMEDVSVDVVFTSPPYNDSAKTQRDVEKKRHLKYQNIEYRDDWYEWQCECITEMMRIAKRQVLYNVQTLLSNKADVYKLIGTFADKIDHILIWYKPNAQPQHYPHRIGNYYEMLLVLKCKKFDKLYINSNGYKNVIVKNINPDHKYSDKHRAIMSKDFADEIIREFTFKGETVFDPFMGLATTGIACINQRRNFIGVEINKEYFDLAEDRLLSETSQMTMFDFV